MTEDRKPHIPRWVMDWSLILAIVVLMTTFVNYGMSFLYPGPEYDDFCGQEQRTPVPEGLTNESACMEAGGKWTSYDEPQAVVPRRIDSSTTTVTGYCDQSYYCRQSYDEANDLHDRNGLLIMLILGLLVSVFGFMRKQSDVVSTAFSIAGIIVIISGLMRFWNVTDDWSLFLLLGSLLLAFVYLAIWQSKNG